MHHASALSQIDQNPVGLRNPQTSSQLSVMDPGHHNGGGPGGVGKAQSVKASSIVVRLFRTPSLALCHEGRWI